MTPSSLDRYSILIDNSPVAMAVFDADMRIIHLNSEFAQVARLEPRLSKGNILYDIAPYSLDRRSVHESVLSGEDRIETSVPRHYQGDPQPTYNDVRYKALKDDSGAVIGMLVTVIDVTEQVLARRALQELIGYREDFLDLSAHELRTPITVIKAFAQLAQRPEFSKKPPWLAYAIDVIGRHADHMVNLVQDMLEVSRMGKGTLPLYKERFDLCELAGSLERDYEPLFESCECTFELPADPIIVEADRNRIGTVFANIVDNAGKYAKEKSPCSIKLALEPKDSEVIASVHDDGIGIPSDQQSKVFDRFFRANNVTTRSRNGLGLGLYICKTIVEQHNGRIWLNSATDEGTTVFFSLPVSAA